MRARVSSPFQATARGDRLDWNDIKDRVDMAAIATALFGPAPKRSGRRLLWPCPFHSDNDPSLQVDPAERRWKCWPCDLGGDAPALVMRLKGVGFSEAVRIVAELAGMVAPSTAPARMRPPIRPGAARPSMPHAGPPGKAARSPPNGPAGLDCPEAERLVADASERLWRPEGATALAYLKGRGLTAETIRRHRLGWTPRVTLPTSDGARFWRASGITIPWLDGDRLAMVKIRQPEGRKPKYAEAFRDRPALYPCADAIRPGTPLIVVEGEFDALLLAQELGDLASVVTLGSASSRPESALYLTMLQCPRWYAAHDADDAGDRAAAEWPARAVRVRPPSPDNDWTEAHRSGVNLCRWWSDRLGGTESHERSTWDELDCRRWGPGLTDPARGVVVDRPARPAIWTGPADDFDRQERAAIMEFDGELSREDAERAAGLRPAY
jgi:hypothetical protein